MISHLVFKHKKLQAEVMSDFISPQRRWQTFLVEYIQVAKPSSVNGAAFTDPQSALESEHITELQQSSLWADVINQLGIINEKRKFKQLQGQTAGKQQPPLRETDRSTDQ